jgi:hypothetical protein
MFLSILINYQKVEHLNCSLNTVRFIILGILLLMEGLDDIALPQKRNDHQGL